VLISWFAANHDEREFERADEVVLDRAPNRHVAFGLGPHRCIGAPLARVVFEVMVKAVLERIPDYEVDLSGVHRYSGNPSMTGLGRLPVKFTPGASLGTSRPTQKSANCSPASVVSVNSSTPVPPTTPSRNRMKSASMTSGTPSSLA